MFTPEMLEKGVIQSENFVEESSPGAGDGKGWRLEKNGNCQLGDMSMVNGEIFSRYGNVRIDGPQLELLYLTQEQIDAAKCDLPPHVLHKPGAGKGVATQCDIEVVVRIDMPVGCDPDKAEGYARSIRQIVMDTIDSSQELKGMRSGRITTEQTVRADADMALASRITAMDVGAGSDWAGVGASLHIPQPGGAVTIGDLEVSLARLGGRAISMEDFRRDPLKGCYRDIEPTKEFLAENVGTNLTPQAACALSLMTPITGNGKAPVNILPRPVDDSK